ncbi:MAG: UvrD-helicase domain-containing protein [Deltaproteobacteria bacterium]|nr:UvrD-helicase domain-containing protein [Candidatus Anaeroferrophillus wilburensis]MBN2889083.1 UvrD-helicase domain-containing protein [Deltaproteobacteria bacterium]
MVAMSRTGYAADPETVLAGLNPGQREAVRKCTGPLLILAGAGSGKTRVIVHRIAYMIGVVGIEPASIMAVTFTNKAAGEMRERVHRMVGPAAGKLWINTFHATCARILRRHIGRLGFSERFVIYDDKDQLSIIKEVFKKHNLSEVSLKPEVVRAVINDAKNKALDADDFSRRASTWQEETIAGIYTAYQQQLQHNDALDFGDLHLKTIKLFSQCPDVLAEYQERFHYLLVDEYQDTNEVQYRLLRMLVEKRGNLCVVGDDDQSIYSWRGARLKNILDFEADYPAALVVRLEENYRSTQNILEAANGVISHNRQRKGKDLWTRNETGALISLHVAADEYDEARFIIGKIRGQERDLADHAIFYRTNAQSRVLEEVLSRQGIPYVIVGGFRFYDRAEVKDLLAYLRVVNNVKDSVSLLRVINVPARGVGKKTVESLKELALAQGCSLWQALELWVADSASAGKSKQALVAFVQQVQEWRRQEEGTISALLQDIIAKTDYSAWLQRGSGAHLYEGKKENIAELFNSIVTWESNESQPLLANYLESVALISEVDRSAPEQSRVTLMTLHSAKGLEFPVVFMAGMEEGLFPNRKCYNRDAEMEEERRLCYVGMTRAREKLYLVASRSRQFQGVRSDNKPSRFLFDIPRQLIQQEDAASGPTHGGKRVREHQQSSGVKPAPAKKVSPGDSSSNAGFPVGCKVIHGVFGPGVVAAREGHGDDLKLVIIFRDRGRKKISLRYAKLERC